MVALVSQLNYWFGVLTYIYGNYNNQHSCESDQTLPTSCGSAVSSIMLVLSKIRAFYIYECFLKHSLAIIERNQFFISWQEVWMENARTKTDSFQEVGPAILLTRTECLRPIQTFNKGVWHYWYTRAYIIIILNAVYLPCCVQS